MATVADWSTTAASNGTTLGINIAENCSAANINNAIREVMAQAKVKFDTIDTSLSGVVTETSVSTLTNKTLTAGVFSAASTVTDSGTIATTSVGFRGIPQNAQTGAYTLVITDNGKHISNTTGGFVIPANASVAFPIGATVVMFNNSGSSQTISITSDTLRQAGTANTGSRTLAQYGLATIVKVTATVWAISGAGVS